jgi:hypothetical protein
MNFMRKFFSLLTAIAFTAFAVPAFAAPEKKYTLDVQPAIVTTGVQKLTLTITNITPGGNSNINTLRVYLPADYTLKTSGTGALPSSPNWTIGTISAVDGGNVVSLSGMSSLKPTQWFTLEVWVNVAASACAAASWGPVAGRQTAWVGNSFNGDTFRQVVSPEAAVNTTTTVPGSNLSIAFDSANPTSVMKGSAVTLKVNLSSSCATILPTSVTLSSSTSAVINSPQTSSSGVATFSATFNTLGEATLTANAGSYGTATSAITVFDGVLGCATGTIDALALPTSGAGTFDASPSGEALGETGFVFGVRANDPVKGVCSDLSKLNYSVVNNILADDGDPPLSDPLGNNVYPGSYSLTWDANQADSSGNKLLPIIAVVATYRSEWGDADTGLPTRKTLICTATPCTAAPYITDPDTNELVINTDGGWKPAVACLSSQVLHASIPKINPTTFEPGCLVSERWDLVNVGDVDYCTGTGPGSTPRCLKPTAIMLMGQDPTWNR